MRFRIVGLGRMGANIAQFGGHPVRRKVDTPPRG
jgi:hypothetical protein